MKKIIMIGGLLSSLTTGFASEKLDCGLFKGMATGEPVKTATADLSQDSIYVYETNQKERASVSISSIETEVSSYIQVRISQPEDYNEIVFDKSVLLAMEEGKSFALTINAAKENRMTAVCYKGKAGFRK